MKQLEVALFPESVIRAPCDTLVVPVPSDERPLRGDAGWVDWRVCGAISRQLAGGFVAGTRGEAVLLPAPPPLQAARILIVGLGRGSQLEGRALQRAFCVIAEKLIDLRTELALLALPGAVDLRLDADLLVKGFLQALSSCPSSTALRLGVASAQERAEALESAVSAAAPEAQRRKVGIDLYWVESDPGHSSRASARG